MEKNLTWRLLLDLALLRKRPVEDFDFPLWQANLFVVLLGILSVQMGFDIQTMAMDAFFGVFIGLIFIFLFVKILLWWLRKEGSGFQGDFLRTYKLTAATSGIDIIFSVAILAYSFVSSGFLAEEVESLLMLVTTLYSLAVFVYAFSNAFGLPKRRILSVTVIASILSLLVSIGLFMLLFMVLSMTGIVPESYYDTL
jgi:hypothetical protein